ncbi:MAG: AAA family ATPase [Bacteroidia bacterium]
MSDSTQSLREALKFSPDNIPLHLLLAETLVASSHYAEAITEYKLILEKDKRNTRAMLGLARCYFKTNELSLSSVVLEDILQKDKGNREALELICRVLVKEKSYEHATEYYKMLLQIDPYFKDEELDSALRQTGAEQPMFIDEEEEEQELNSFLEKPDVNFSSVGGMQKVKDEIDLKIIKPLQFTDLYKAYGKKTGGGILLYGPPGCGKTHIARATAGQINSKFISVGISDVLDMWIGASEKNLQSLFDLARDNNPCVIFFDEVDALGASRKDMKNSSGRHLINQFLSELDGIEANNDGVLVLAATNAPWHLDPAFRRPGRFDRIIFVPPPDEESRAAIMKIVLEGKPISDMNYNEIAKMTPDYSGADLKALVDIAIEEKLSESFKTGVPSPLSTKDIAKAVKRHKPTTKEWFTAARNYALYSNESGLYDDILKYLNIKK